MTRSPRDPRPAAAPREPRSPRSSMLAGAPLAVLLSVIGLAIVALGTFALGSGDLPFNIGGGGKTNPNASGGTGGNGGAAKTPTPSNIVVVPTDMPATLKVPGTLVYAKDGNIWLQSNGQANQLTTGGNDSMPSFSADGQTVYFIRVRLMPGNWGLGCDPYNPYDLCKNGNRGTMNGFEMNVPSVMAVPVAGGTAKTVIDGLINAPGTTRINAFILEPVVSADGKTLALATDLPDPTGGADVRIKLLNLSSGHLADPKLADVAPLGQQDPAWRPDGRMLAYVMNNHNQDRSTGAPQICIYIPATGDSRAISGPGYLHPSWSPDGKYIAATKTSAYGTDVVILNASTGAEVTTLTQDGTSWAPAWSPAGDQIAFLHVSGQVVDLRLVTLAGSYGDWTPGDAVDLTQDAGLDSISRPDWYVPADQIPAATPAPAATGGSPTAPANSSSAAPSPS